MGVTKLKKDVKTKAAEAKSKDVTVKEEIKLPAHVKHEPFDLMDRLFSNLKVVGMGCEESSSGDVKVTGYFVLCDSQSRDRPMYLPAKYVPKTAVDEFRREALAPL